ncbi:hypothetical protein EKH77_17105 [Streptomyces luteoverticillatus]|uniref:Uncharacterized protein n=1 Tax=Streptomyces luteoverticillatus TaxID=66425 RepID=A0A3Q9G0F1_STRLT|nr:hypothetical protein [Streptomyces luteoverticillatus]AZQ72710.1 hypothetical protein EKH77_17105 [Streptomyces luteoverticillatus]
MTSIEPQPTIAEYLDTARECQEAGYPVSAWLFAEEAVELTDDPSEVTRIRAEFPRPNTSVED